LGLWDAGLGDPKLLTFLMEQYHHPVTASKLCSPEESSAAVGLGPRQGLRTMGHPAEPCSCQGRNGPSQCWSLSQSHSRLPSPSDPGAPTGSGTHGTLAPVLLRAAGVCAEKLNLILFKRTNEEGRKITGEICFWGNSVKDRLKYLSAGWGLSPG